LITGGNGGGGVFFGEDGRMGGVGSERVSSIQGLKCVRKREKRREEKRRENKREIESDAGFVRKGKNYRNERKGRGGK